MDWEWLKSIWQFVRPSEPQSHTGIRRRSASERMRWHIDQAGHLIINGRHIHPTRQWTRQYFEEALARLNAKVDLSGWPVTIFGLAIEEHVAQSLWMNGVITREHVQGATFKDHQICFRLRLRGEEIEVCVVTATYYSDYEFIVSGHPQGHVRVRDIPDPLAIVANEQVF